MSHSTTTNTNSYRNVSFSNSAIEVLEQLGKEFHQSWLCAKIEHVSSQVAQAPSSSPAPSSSSSESSEVVVVGVDFGVHAPNFEGILFDNCGHSVKEMFGEEDHRAWLNAKIAHISNR